METRHNKKISTIQIRPYQETDFERLAQIHDCARKSELALADLKKTNFHTMFMLQNIMML